MAKAVYPGSFDPVTYGHLDVIERAAAVFAEVNVAVVVNPNKNPLFSLSERVEMLEACTKHLPNVTITQFEGLLVKYVQDKGAQVIIKGLRAILETLFMMTSSQYSYLSSSMAKEVLRLGGCVKDLVPPLVEERMRLALKIGVAK